MKWVIEATKHANRKKSGTEFNHAMNKAMNVTPQQPDLQAINDAKAYDAKAQQYYIIIDDDKSFQKDYKEKFKVWITYPTDYELTPNLQKNYEIFCGGWLHFWDLEISVESEQRQLYFEWTTNEVIIYISQPPLRQRSYKTTVCIESPGDPPVMPPPPPPGD